MNKRWMKWCPADWRADPCLRGCSYAARGLWVDLISIMHEAEPYGHLLVNGVAPDARKIASLLGGTRKIVENLLKELEISGVFSRNEDGVIYSRRMLRDEVKALKDKENGRLGGNPRVNPGVNPPLNPGVRARDRAKTSDLRKKEDSDADASDGVMPSKASDPVKNLWDRGLAIFGEKRRALFGKYRKTYGDVIVLAAIVECENELPSDPVAYFVACCERRRRNARTGDAQSGLATLADWARAEDERQSFRRDYEAPH
jgi:hypothetical protein